MSTQNHRALLVLGLALFGALGCASLQSVSLTSIPQERGTPIEATENNLAFLGLHFDNDFADEVPEALRRQCPRGKVTGIYAKYESTWYVLFQNRSVTAKAYCVRGLPSTAQAASPEPGPVNRPPTALSSPNPSADGPRERAGS